VLEKNRRRSLKAAIGTATLGAAMVAVPVAQANTALKTSVSNTYQTNGRVSAIVTIGGTTYIGGSFTSVRPYGSAAGSKETPRAHLAAINSDGTLNGWNPGANAAVLALAASPDGSTVYAGGDFTTVANVTRPHVAALGASSGTTTAFNPSTDLSVLSIAATSTKVYLGGSFTKVGAASRAHLAAVSQTGTLDTTWKPTANAAVRAVRLSPSASDVYVGGGFSAINGSTTQKNLARLSPSSGAVSAWSSHPKFPVYAIATTTGQVFVGGNGTGGHAAAYSATGSQQWLIQTDGGVQAIAAMNGVTYVGGHFDNLCTGDTTGGTSGFSCPTGQVAATRHKLFAVNASSGALDPWAPNPNSNLGVWSMEAHGTSLDVGGDFTAIGAPRSSQQGFARFG